MNTLLRKQVIPMSQPTVTALQFKTMIQHWVCEVVNILTIFFPQKFGTSVSRHFLHRAKVQASFSKENEKIEAFQFTLKCLKSSLKIINYKDLCFKSIWISLRMFSRTVCANVIWVGSSEGCISYAFLRLGGGHCSYTDPLIPLEGGSLCLTSLCSVLPDLLKVFPIQIWLLTQVHIILGKQPQGWEQVCSRLGCSKLAERQTDRWFVRIWPQL